MKWRSLTPGANEIENDEKKGMLQFDSAARLQVANVRIACTVAGM